jgi:hypothetical protein
MKRNLIVLGCAGLLAIGLSISGVAGVVPDTDMDGVLDDADNCLLVPNGPLASTYSCTTQLDGNLDGYGNPCDTDLDNDGGTSLADVNLEFGAAQAISGDPQFDIDCDGGASLADVNIVFGAAVAILPPGPSGLACAGTIPCP